MNAIMRLPKETDTRMSKAIGKVIDRQRATDLLVEPAPYAQMLAALGVSTAPAHVISSTVESIDSANSMIENGLAQPRLIAAEFGIDGMAPGEIVVDGSIIIPCDSSIFEGAERIIAAIITLGPRLEQAVKSAFAENDPLLAVTLDAAGTILVRNASTQFQRECETRANAIGLELGSRASPGCLTVPLEAQKALFSLLDAQSIGVALTQSLLMMPVKSVSLMFPLGANLPERVKTMDMCQTCRHSATCMQIVL